MDNIKFISLVNAFAVEFDNLNYRIDYCGGSHVTGFCNNTDSIEHLRKQIELYFSTREAQYSYFTISN